jgi:very-short-patch-repair endonuclease
MGEYTDRPIWTTAQLRAAGHTNRDIRRGVEQGELTRVAHGYYVSTDDPRVTLMAFAKAYPGITFTGRTAAFLFGALPMEWPATAEHPTSRTAAPRLVLRRRAKGPTRQVEWVDAAVPARVAVELMDTDEDTAVRVLERGYPGFTGTRRLEEDTEALTRRERTRLASILPRAVLGTASGLERTAVTVVKRALADEVAAGLVTVETNTLFRGYWFDLVIREARLLIEIDSYAFHGEGRARRSAFVRDRHKGNQATRWGWLLLRYPDHAVKHMPGYVGAEVADTVRFVLAHDRYRREDEALDTDRPVQDWYPPL